MKVCWNLTDFSQTENQSDLHLNHTIFGNGKPIRLSHTIDGNGKPVRLSYTTVGKATFKESQKVRCFFL